MIATALLTSWMAMTAAEPVATVLAFDEGFWAYERERRGELQHGDQRKKADKKWSALLTELATWQFHIMVLADSGADPWLLSQDPGVCNGKPKATLGEHTPRTAVVDLDRARAVGETCLRQVHLEKQGSSWRVAAVTRKAQSAEQPAAPLVVAADAAPEVRAKALYERYLPSSVSLDGYPAPRMDSTMLAISPLTTRRLMLRLLIDDPRPRDEKYRDTLVCFTPKLGMTAAADAITVVSTKTTGKRAVVIVEHAVSGDEQPLHPVRAELIMKRERTGWMVDDVKCPR